MTPTTTVIKKEGNKFVKFKSSEKSNVQLSEYGKMMPSAIDIEEAVLGAILLEKGAMMQVSDIIEPEFFYDERHELIYRAIFSLYKKSLPIDILTVTNELKECKKLERVGGAYYIAKLTNRLASAAHIEYHSKILAQKYIQRELIRISNANQRDAFDNSNDVFELIDKAYTSINSITNKIIKTPAKGSKYIFGEFIKQLENMSNNESAITGVPTTIKNLNRVTRGFQKSDLIIIAGRPAMGKTAALKPIIKGAIDSLKKPVLVFSLEMSAQQQVMRLVSEDLKVPSQHFNSNEFLKSTNWNAINSSISNYFVNGTEDLLIVDDTPNLTINELKARAKRLFAEKQLSIIMVDYIGMLKSTNTNKVYEIEEIVAGLKELAKELNIPVVALAQLNRDVEKEKPPRPQLSHLRSSGSLEQYADLIIFLYRPEYYGIQELENGETSHQYAEWIIAKHRNGGLSTVRTRFISEYTKFCDWDLIEQSIIPDNPNSGLSPNNNFFPENDSQDKPF